MTTPPTKPTQNYIPQWPAKPCRTQHYVQKHMQQEHCSQKCKAVLTAHLNDTIFFLRILATSLFSLSFFISGCTAPDNTILINIPFQLNTEVTGLKDLRFYLHDIRLINKQGVEIPLELEQNEHTQYHNIALIDLRPNATSLQKSLHGQIPAGEYQSITFNLGLPFGLNHANPLKAPAPLNLGELFWTWQLGYKFLRLDIQTTKTAWSLHLGSNGCHSPSALRPPLNTCEQPNLAQITLKNFNPNYDHIAFNLNYLLTGPDNSPEENCMGNYHNKPYCRHILQQLGLNADTGQCENYCANQTVFTITKPPTP